MVTSIALLKKFSTVEVFRTNVHRRADADWVIESLQAWFPTHRITIDTADCDNVLRIKGVGTNAAEVAATVRLLGFRCDIME